MTADDDIGFAIHYDKTGMANNLTEMETIFPYIRLESSLVPVSGSILCEKPGRCKCVCVCVQDAMIFSCTCKTG